MGIDEYSSHGHVFLPQLRSLFDVRVLTSYCVAVLAGLFTINFKREFVRCCCCFRSNWSQKKLIMTFTRNYFWRTHHKSPYTRTSYSSVRTPYSSSLGKGFNNNGRLGRHPFCARYKPQNNIRTGQNKVALELKQLHNGKADGHKVVQNGAAGSNARMNVRPELNQQAFVRSKSDSGIALQTLASVSTEQAQACVSI